MAERSAESTPSSHDSARSPSDESLAASGSEDALLREIAGVQELDPPPPPMVGGMLAHFQVNSCSLPAGAPRDYLRGKLALGQASERTGDKAGACTAYLAIIDRWGKATPRSVTATEARARANALGCPTPSVKEGSQSAGRR